MSIIGTATNHVLASSALGGATWGGLALAAQSTADPAGTFSILSEVAKGGVGVALLVVFLRVMKAFDAYRAETREDNKASRESVDDLAKALNSLGEKVTVNTENTRSDSLRLLEAIRSLDSRVDNVSRRVETLGSDGSHRHAALLSALDGAPRRYPSEERLAPPRSDE